VPLISLSSQQEIQSCDFIGALSQALVLDFRLKLRLIWQMVVSVGLVAVKEEEEERFENVKSAKSSRPLPWVQLVGMS
jgi:hypothetical protein